MAQRRCRASESQPARPVNPYNALAYRKIIRKPFPVRLLATRIGSEATNSDIKAATRLPDDAIIKFSEERNHELARMIGTTLGHSGYRWRVEKIPTPVGSHRNMIEVWLPKK
jgi:hypothetical protein